MGAQYILTLDHHDEFIIHAWVKDGRIVHAFLCPRDTPQRVIVRWSAA